MLGSYQRLSHRRTSFRNGKLWQFFDVSSKESIYQETFNAFPGTNDSTVKKPTKDPPNHHQPSPPSQKASKSNLKSAQLAPPQKLRMHEMLVATPRPPMGWTHEPLGGEIFGASFWVMISWQAWYHDGFCPCFFHHFSWSCMIHVPPSKKQSNQ